MAEESVYGIITNIQPYSVHDGPGIRTLVFFKGCSLRCQWCSNPENIFSYPQLRFFPEACVKNCSDCIDSCASNAINKIGDQLKIDFNICNDCNDKQCISTCKKKALQICGYRIGAEELVNEIEKDIPFFGDDGGVTLSGGEPLQQADFAYSILKKCKEKGISTAVESCLNVPLSTIEKCLPYIDFFMFDIKIISAQTHFDYCKTGNAQILNNIKFLSAIAKIPLLPRFPLIPALTDDNENILNIIEFMKKCGLKYLNVLPYMKLGINKYEQIGTDYALPSTQPPSKVREQEIISLFEKNGICCI
jgi:pyruvate formate lyase activating enzyme